MIRSATELDAAAIAAIYAPIVRDTAISFELDAPADAEMARRIRDKTRFPWLVDEVDGAVVGYAYASSFRERAAYDWCTEVTVYVGATARRTGAATRLYRALFRLLELQGYAMAYAGIVLPNAASVGFHEAMGFTRVGTFSRAGFKFGGWHDLGFWERPLATPSAPRTPEPASALIAGSAWAAAIAERD